MRFLAAVTFSILFSCSGNDNKEDHDAAKLSPPLLELIAYMNDSVAPCHVWLAQDDKRRKFISEDSSAEMITNRFNHDQILSWYQSLDSTDLVDATPYLEELHIEMVTHMDSVGDCASAINAVAFSHENKEALVLFVVFKKPTSNTYTLLMERASVSESWYVADTLQQSVF